MPRPARAKPKDKIIRLDARAWIAAAFDALAEGGIARLRTAQDEAVGGLPA